MGKLKDLQVKTARLPVNQKEMLLTDGGGLSLRLRLDGSKSWLFQYTSPTVSKSRPKITLGHYGEMTLEEARFKAAEYRKQVANGIDPKIEAKQDALLSDLGGDTPRTVRELFKRWVKDWLISRHSDQGAYVIGMLERHALPHLGDIALDRLRAPHITATLAKINGGNPSRTAGVVLTSLRQLFSHGVEHGYLQGDPSAAIKKSKWDNSAPRERVLSEEEITFLASIIPDAELPLAVECALWLTMSCLTRIEETSLARRQDVNLDEGIWRIPKENQKKTRRRKKLVDHYVTLSPFSKKWFERLIELPQERAERRNSRLPKSRRLEVVPAVVVDLLFPDRSGKKAITRQTVEHALDDRQRHDNTPRLNRTTLVDSLILPGGKFTPHDTRRTGSTIMRELGVSQDVVDRCLNHVDPDPIVATYQHAQLRDEKRKAWFVLGERLEKLTSPEAIAAIKKKSLPQEEEEDI